MSSGWDDYINLDEIYEEIIRPRNMFAGWSYQEFFEWCDGAETDDDLWFTYLALRDDEMYDLAYVVLTMLVPDLEPIVDFTSGNLFIEA